MPLRNDTESIFQERHYNEEAANGRDIRAYRLRYAVHDIFGA